MLKRGEIGSASLGLACMAIAAMLYSVFDAIAKWMVADFSPFQIVFFRAAFAFLPWAWLAVREPVPARVLVTPWPGLQVLRGVLGFAAITCFIVAFRELPLAIAASLAYSAPLYTTALATPLLGERVGLAKWLIVCVGFAGVLVITRPLPGAIEAGALWAVGGSVLYAFSSLLTRHLGGADRAPTTMFYSMVVYMALGGAVLGFVWRQPDLAQWGGFLVLGLVAGTAQCFLFNAFRHAPASTVSPLEYSILAWSLVWGYVGWRDVPDATSFLGMLLIIAAGVALVRHGRERPLNHSGPR